MKFYIGKFGRQNPEQIEQRFYAGGKKGGPWYGGVEEGDYVFPVFKGKINELWQAEKYQQIPNRISKEGVLTFKLVKTFDECQHR